MPEDRELVGKVVESPAIVRPRGGRVADRQNVYRPRVVDEPEPIVEPEPEAEPGESS